MAIAMVHENTVAAMSEFDPVEEKMNKTPG
jgi:hypothetical protein